ncbi:MAG: hypothetical protein Q8876_10115, partial [Bacillota bacterium]|nr:hypothetical protein [Bacillota bacterium]
MANTPIEQQFTLAMHYYNMRRYDVAEKYLSDLLAQEPHNNKYLFYYACTLLSQNKDKQRFTEIFESMFADKTYGFISRILLAEHYCDRISIAYRMANLQSTQKGGQFNPFLDFIKWRLKMKKRKELRQKVKPLIDDAAGLNPSNILVFTKNAEYFRAYEQYRKAKQFIAKAEQINH